MAKGNIFMGTLKGRVGASVFYVKQGEQNQIKHQTEVSNPKTYAQCLQRSKFSSAGKFYTHGTQALFKFAFENKKKGESDFNAFMKANIDMALPMSKYAIDNANYPMVNEWLLTKGSLVAPRTYVSIAASNNEVTGAFDLVGAAPASISNVAELTKAIVDGVSVKEGDIITFVLINTQLGAQSYPAINPDILLQPQYAWKIVQIKLDSLDTTSLASINLEAETSSRAVSVTYKARFIESLTSYLGGAVILSRRTASGLKVSTNRLAVVNNDTLQQPLDQVRIYANSEAYKNAIIPSWQDGQQIANSTDIILEGALVSKASVSVMGNNPIKESATLATAQKLILPFDPRDGYLTVGPFSIDKDVAITDAENGNLKRYYYNRRSGYFAEMTTGEIEYTLNVTNNNDGTFSVWRQDSNDLYAFIKAWTNEQGQTIEFSQVGS